MRIISLMYTYKPYSSDIWKELIKSHVVVYSLIDKIHIQLYFYHTKKQSLNSMHWIVCEAFYHEIHSIIQNRNVIKCQGS